MKICKTCNEELSLDNFTKRSCAPDGLDLHCKSCKNTKAKSYYKSHPECSTKAMGRSKSYRTNLYEIIINNLKLNFCVDCNESDIRVLEFDHVRGDKKFEIAIAAHNVYSEDNLKEEIAKCEIRCRNCHKLRTAKQFNHIYDRWYEQYLAEGKVDYK